MRMTHVRSAASALVIAALALPAAAFAQAVTTPGATPAPAATAAPPAVTPATPAPATKATASKPAPARHATPADRVEQRITQLHTQLKITAGQQAQWDQFAAVMRANAQSTTQAYEDRSTKVATMSAADIMQSYAQLSEAHAQDLQKLAAAFQTLYTALTPDQQKAADQVFRGPARRHG